MKILKPGKVEQRKFVCPKCGCVFVASESEMNGDIELMVCPQDGCHYYAIGWDDGEPYEEPVQAKKTDTVRLVEILRKTDELPWPVTTQQIAEFLITNGATFREDA